MYASRDLLGGPGAALGVMLRAPRLSRLARGRPRQLAAPGLAGSRFDSRRPLATLPLLGAALFLRRARTQRAAASVAEAPAGEWAFRASVLGCEGALSGHVYLDETGRAAYLADGVQIVGRGVGHWATNGEMVALELDVYQYAAAAAVIPEKPHRFRG
ncbi:unnamed protein product, partial [Effrenium voratum]